jgi:tRNA(adenine34) deaminase
MTQTTQHEKWMTIALEEADAAAREGEIPIGAVAVWQGGLLARNHNRSIQLHDPTAHAEILVLREAARLLQNYRLPGAEIYVTVEPCAMCAGALVWARVSRLVFGARDDKAGAVFSKLETLRPGLLNHCVAVTEGVRDEECRAALRRFFADRRGNEGEADG